MKRYFITLFLAYSLSLLPAFAQSPLQHVEPPHWWVGMKNPHLQLLIHGNNIGAWMPSIDYDGVQIQQVRRVENANYLFVDLYLDKEVQAGSFDIVFSENGKEVHRHRYTLEARAQEAPYQQGFDNADVLYLITPDRFANGNPENDEFDDLKEKQNRTFKGGRHGGDIEGIAKHLDYIKEMGFTAIWLNPVLENDMPEYSYHGYSTTDFYKVDPRFGSNESYRQLAQTAQQKGIKLIMDMIVNHCGLDHWWMNDLPTSDWINQWETYTQTNHRKSLLQDPYASALDRKTFTDGWFVPTMPDLNQRNPLMATYLTQNAIWWIEYLGLAGIRMDTYPYPDMDYMTEWTRRVMEEYPNFNVVGEEWYGDPTIVSYWQAGKQNPNGYTSYLPSLMDFPSQVALVEALTQEEGWSTGWMRLYELLAQDFLYPDAYNLVTFPDNHDMSRIYTQINENYDHFKLAMTFVTTTRGIPQIYYGTEILMSDNTEGDHGIIRSDFPGGWKGDQVNAFTGKGLSQQQKDAQTFTRQLLEWRKNTPTIHTGKLTHFVPQDGVYVYFRYDDNGTYMIVLNKNENAYALSLARFAELLDGYTGATDVLSNTSFDLTKGTINLPPVAPLILELVD